MSELVWDATGEHFYETGVDKVALYLLDPLTNTYGEGVAWNGVTSISESPSGADETKLYADNIKYLSLRAAEEYGSTIEAYQYPDEWEQCDGSEELAPGVYIDQQSRRTFGLAYRTLIGNDVKGNDFGYKLHLVYGATAAPSDRQYETVNDSPSAISMSWELSTVPVAVNGFKPTAHIEIDSRKANATKLALLEGKLFGTDGVVSYTEFTGSAFAEGTTYYERSGTEPNYVYTPTSDTEYNSQKTYYTKTVTGGTAPYLPLPDEVKSTMTVNG